MKLLVLFLVCGVALIILALGLLAHALTGDPVSLLSGLALLLLGLAIVAGALVEIRLLKKSDKHTHTP